MVQDQWFLSPLVRACFFVISASNRNVKLRSFKQYLKASCKTLSSFGNIFSRYESDESNCILLYFNGWEYLGILEVDIFFLSELNFYFNVKLKILSVYFCHTSISIVVYMYLTGLHTYIGKDILLIKLAFCIK